jgi:protein-S-isoprenylcysteine O-methyltransferase Ste14
VFALCLSVVGAFHTTPGFRSSSCKVAVTALNNRNAWKTRHMATPLAEWQDKVQQAIGKIKDSGGFNLDMDVIKSNLSDGEFGSRGEVYAFAQLAMIACILGGGIPFVGDFLMFLLGPGLLVAGLGVLALSLTDLGNSLSPWPLPASDGQLETGGIYAELRHPMYAGSLAACAGLSIITGSATRLLLTAVLLYVLELKADYEEKALVEKFPEYLTYKETVPSKFVPVTIVRALPWRKAE